ncbi:MAG: hypothetical protein HJJLKODD_00591 [Phycisphaerae bacterium]|nr:hypothetical protein [Phycisphaerae bacterium]
MNWSTTTIAIYGLTALGAVAVYLLLPRAGRSARVAGTLLGLAALAGLVVLSLRSFAIPGSEDFYFYLLAVLALTSAAGVITQRKAVYSALYFVLTVVAVAGLVVLLEAEFLAAALIIIYGGAILVTYLFVIMLAQQEGQPLYDRRVRGGWWACVAGFLLTATVASALSDFLLLAPVVAPPMTVEVANTDRLGLVVMTRYMVVLQAAGILLLLALVGAVAIVRKRYPHLETVERPLPAIGQAGREAAPF